MERQRYHTQVKTTRSEPVSAAGLPLPSPWSGRQGGGESFPTVRGWTFQRPDYIFLHKRTCRVKDEMGNVCIGTNPKHLQERCYPFVFPVVSLSAVSIHWSTALVSSKKFLQCSCCVRIYSLQHSLRFLLPWCCPCSWDHLRIFSSYLLLVLKEILCVCPIYQILLLVPIFVLNILIFSRYKWYHLQMMRIFSVLQYLCPVLLLHSLLYWLRIMGNDG